MSRRSTPILQVALPVPVRRVFDYLPDQGYFAQPLPPGIRVVVPFGGRKQLTGILVGTSTASDIPGHKLKRIIRVIDQEPLFDPTHLELLRWAGDYYHYPLGELLMSTLPASLRNGKQVALEGETVWVSSCGDKIIDDILPAQAKKQRVLLEQLGKRPESMTEPDLNMLYASWRSSMKSLQDKGLVEKIIKDPVQAKITQPAVDIVLSAEQQAAVQTILEGLESGRCYLLDGITGSGKTEVYLEVIKHVVRRQQQAMILVPEIGLTPHFIARIRDRIGTQPVVMHSGLSDSERLQAWLQAHDGTAQVVLGTRSAVWTPLKSPGIFIVDEEHDPSYKQQDSFRYSARDIAILRSSNARVPVILGSATPSLESQHNCDIDKFKRIQLTKRVENAVSPHCQIIDMRNQKSVTAISDTLANAIKSVLADKRQVLLFLNKRGYSPVLMCNHCNRVDICSRCNLPMTYHKGRHRVICHHCGSQRTADDICPDCGESEMVRIGHGTERLSESLAELFPAANILRIDRDSTRRKGSMEAFVDQITSGQADILVGTQMLAKGHHFPNVTLVGIIDADRGLYSADFRASERMAQLITQVSGRAGRAAHPGTVMIQTRFPDHPLLTTLLNHDYNTFARLLMQERQSANLPPFSYMALLRVESFEHALAMEFLNKAINLLGNSPAELELSGPFPAPIEKRAGKLRYQLLLQSDQRSTLQKTLQVWVQELEQLKSGKKIRWSLDVDPQEML